MKIFGPKVFISYRHSDTESESGWLADNLEQEFGKANVYHDIKRAELRVGREYERPILDKVRSADIFIAVIGKNWLSATDGFGSRLNDPEDFLRREIALALELQIPVIPVLVNDASMPRQADLPEDLKRLAKLEPERIYRHRREVDVERLIKTIRRLAREGRSRRRVDESSGSKSSPIIGRLVDSLKEQDNLKRGLYWLITSAVIVLLFAGAVIIIVGMLGKPSQGAHPGTVYFVVDAAAGQQDATYNDLRRALQLSAGALSRDTRIGLRIYGGDGSQAQNCASTTQLLKSNLYSDPAGEIESVLSQVPAQGRGSLVNALLTALSSDLAGESGTIKIYALVSGVNPACETMSPDTLKSLVAQTGRQVEFVLINIGVNDPATESMLKGYANALSGNYIYTANAATVQPIISSGSYGYGYGYGYDYIP